MIFFKVLGRLYPTIITISITCISIIIIIIMCFFPFVFVYILYVWIYVCMYEGGPKNKENLKKKIIYFSEHFQNLTILKILSLRINTLIPPLFPLFKTVLELLQSDNLQCLRRFLAHLLCILKTLSFKVPFHSWKQEKCDDFGQNVWISFQLIFHFTANIQTIGSLILREQARNEFRSSSFHVKFFC